MKLFDAHNHLQDARFAGRREELIAACRSAGVAGMVVNGCQEADWPRVAALAEAHPDLIVPSFGCHPWEAGRRTSRWEERLREWLRRFPRAGVGEIGLDRWKPDLDFAPQPALFRRQLELAAELDRPVSIHCLRAWGMLFDLLRAGPRPRRGFLLHSYGGPLEMIVPLAKLGAWFSLPGAFARERKIRQRALFQAVPEDRLLIETDAPDQLLPAARVRHPLTDPATGRKLNHPANLEAVYEFAAALRDQPLPRLAARIEANFRRLFGPLPPAEPLPPRPTD